MDLQRLRAAAGHRLCRHLRCKEMTYHGSPDAQESASLREIDADNVLFWCLKTARSLGPNGENVGAEDCDPNRSCYES